MLVFLVTRLSPVDGNKRMFSFTGTLTGFVGRRAYSSHVSERNGRSSDCQLRKGLVMKITVQSSQQHCRFLNTSFST